jgi:hypothetical protein
MLSLLTDVSLRSFTDSESIYIEVKTFTTGETINTK